MREKLEGISKKEWIDGRRLLLEWYETNQRHLPWRANPSAYGVWLCEIIMQQTRIEQGLRYWHSFTDRWPDVFALADASIEEVLKEWQGLGYYSRARNLHRAARYIVDEWGGQFRKRTEDWLLVPGVGPYTASAITSIAFGTPAAAVDGNVLRVISRYLDIRDPIDRPQGRKAVEFFAQEWLDERCPGTHNQAVMELGALVCTPRAPLCDGCPLQAACKNQQFDSGRTPEVPLKAGKTKTVSQRIAFHVISDGEHVWMQQRPDGGIWGGLWEFPSAMTSMHEPSHAAQLPLGLDEQDGLEHLGQWGDEFEHVLSHRKFYCSFQSWKPTPSFHPPFGKWLAWKDARNLAIPRAIDRFWEQIEKSFSNPGPS